MSENFTKNNQFAEVGIPIALASNTDSNSDRLDTQGWEGVTFHCVITDSVVSGVATLTVEQNTVDSDTGMAALAGAVATTTATATDSSNNTFLEVEVYQPRERYLQCVRTTGTAQMAFGPMTAILSRPRKKPITPHASLAATALVAGPAES